MDLIYIEEAIKEAKRCEESKDVPIGAVVVCEGQIIGRGHNSKLESKDPTAHAEVLAIRDACINAKDWRLNNCDVYVTLEPCHMCLEVLKEARVRNVFYLINRLDYKKPYNRTNVCALNNENMGILAENYQKYLSDFFKINCKR